MTVLHDVPNRAKFGVSLAPGLYSDEAVGEAVELTDTDGPAFVLLVAAEFPTGTTASGAVQESANGSTWTAVTGGTIPATNGNETVAVRFVPEKRYLRTVVTFAGETTEGGLAAVIGRPRKVM